MVVGENIEKQLQPFHEFECTGTNDEFVQNIDLLPELRKKYVDSTETISRLRDASGKLHCPYDDQFYRDPTPEEAPHVGRGTGCGHGMSWTSKDWGDGRDYRAKVRFVPEGYEEVRLPKSEVMTFLEFVQYEHEYKIMREGTKPRTSSDHKFGWIRLSEAGEVLEVVKRTNPNAKWDWYVVGGRWAGFLRLRPGSSGELEAPCKYSDHEERERIAKKQGIYADSCRWGDVDVEGMEAEAEEKARATFAKWRGCFETHGKPELWETLRDRLGVEPAREVYGAQPAIAAYQKIDVWGRPNELGFDEEAYVTKMRRKAIVPFAILHEGVWRARGEMGWFACVSDEKDDWEEQAHAFLKGLPPETRVTMVDCHI